ncbi:MAG: hypothetical protein JWO89_3701 [Verrucomicrobiaceae bacterium]|nr:hypothetical protein [Verrucomicrobiaceae bacterium]
MTLACPWLPYLREYPALTTTESKNVRFAVTTSVTVHVILLLIMAWFMGLSTSARLMLKQQLAAKEEPKVTMIFPEQLVPSAKLRPKLDLSKQFIRTSNEKTSTEKPTKGDFISDRNTKASSNAAPFPDGNVAMPSSRGDTRSAPELTNREFRDGKKAGDPLHPAVTPLQPQEPTTVPQLKPTPKPAEVAKKDASNVSKMIEEMDKNSDRMDVTKLPLQVKKAEAAVSAAAIPPAPVAPKDEPGEFSAFTRKSGVKGTLSSTAKGGDSVNAEDAPLGRFRSAVQSAVEKKWNEYRLKHAGAVTSGFLRLHFYVNRSGHVEQPEFIEKTSDSLVQDFTLEAILAAELPPIPKDLLPLLEDDRIPFEYSIIIND